MIIAFSTSSPVVSVAVLSENGDILAAGEELAPMAASGACLNLLDGLLNQSKKNLDEATLYLADLGPGSFTGVKVGVTLAKSLAFANGCKAGGAPSFDLIDPVGTVALPSKKSEFFVRRVGRDPIRQPHLPEEPFSGFGPGVDDPVFPSAVRFAAILDRIARVDPEFLLPNYVLPPSISQPKTAFGAGVRTDA